VLAMLKCARVSSEMQESCLCQEIAHVISVSAHGRHSVGDVLRLPSALVGNEASKKKGNPIEIPLECQHSCTAPR
jgi:hypothetical protein